MIWAGFGLIGNTEKKKWADYEQLMRAFFHVLRTVFVSYFLVIVTVIVTVIVPYAMFILLL